MSIGSFLESLSQQTSAGILGREIGRTPKVCAQHPSKACRTLVCKWPSRPGDAYAKHGLCARSGDFLHRVRECQCAGLPEFAHRCFGHHDPGGKRKRFRVLV